MIMAATGKDENHTTVADLGGVDGFGWTPLSASSHPESPGNGVSDAPDFNIFQGSMPPDPPSLLCHWHSQIQTPLHKILDLHQYLIGQDSCLWTFKPSRL